MKARILHSALLTVGFFLMAAAAPASDLEDLCRKGYAVVDTTRVKGKFEGCKIGKKITLKNGLVFVCSESSYHYAYQPEVLILKNINTALFGCFKYAYNSI